MIVKMTTIPRPKGLMNAYIFYAIEQRSIIRDRYIASGHNVVTPEFAMEIIAEIASNWVKLTNEERAPYVKKQKADMIRWKYEKRKYAEHNLLYTDKELLIVIMSIRQYVNISNRDISFIIASYIIY